MFPFRIATWRAIRHLCATATSLPLKYSLYPNPFRKKEYMASVQPDRISALDDVLTDMAKRSRRYSAAEL